MVRNNPYLSAAIGLLATITTACTSTADKPIAAALTQDSPSSATVTPAEGFGIVTWNVEHLAYPISQGCRPRTEEELTQLQRYAESLDADIVALQEVGSAAAVALLFPENEWQIVMSQRPDSESYTCRKTGFTSTQQKVAYAVRKGITVEQVNSLAEFGLDSPGLRHGLEITVNSPIGSMALLNLHMKSGCFVDNYSRADSDACQTFAKQAPILDNWVEQKERVGTPYVVLGDLNHRLTAPYNHLTRQLTSNQDNTPSSLENVGADLIGCHPYYPAR